MNNADIKRSLFHLTKEIARLDKEIAHLPRGNFFVTKEGARNKWYNYLDGKCEYIPKIDKELAKQLAYKKYCKNKKAKLELELKETKEYLLKMEKIENLYNDNYDHKDFIIEGMFSDSRYKDLMCDTMNSEKSIDVLEWIKEPYMTNLLFPEQLTKPTLAGHKVRSKSEMVIANLLFERGIPYRYECALQLSSGLVFPDFTILHPWTKQIWYFEHFGMMDDPVYSNKTGNKLDIYAQNDIIIGKNLLATFETGDFLTDVRWIAFMIDWYFGEG